MDKISGSWLAADAVRGMGRGKDSMLVHMTPNEVMGLEHLAAAVGGKLSINPRTGLREAGILDAILPALAGFALGPAGLALMSAPMAALTVGGTTAALSNNLSRGLSAGLGAYGGANIGGALASTGNEAAKLAMLPEGGASIPESLIQPGLQTVAPNVAPSALSGLTSQGVLMTPSQMATLQAAAPTGFSSVGYGVKDLFTSGGVNRFGSALAEQAGGILA